MMYTYIMLDLIIIGGGPAGAAAGVYASRKRLKTALITDSFGGQSVVSADIQNWIGSPHISGDALAKSLEAHVREYAGDITTIYDHHRVVAVRKDSVTFSVDVQDRSGSVETLTSRSVLVATGSKRKKLQAVGADIFEHKGVTYCASCDGPVFSGMPVAVIGGGNAAFETALQLSAYCSHVYLLNRTDTFRADEITVEKARKKENLTIITNASTDEVVGSMFVEKLIYTESGEKKELTVNGVFVEIGQEPNTDFVKGLVDMNTVGNIVVNPKTQRTSVDGVWAAGDCTDGLYHQNNIATGDAVKALEDAYVWLQG